MTTTGMTWDGELADETAMALRALLQVHGLPGIAGGAHGGGPLGGVISSPSEPLALHLSDGREIHLIIAAYRPAETDPTQTTEEQK